MLIFDSKAKTTKATTGGYQNDGLPIRDTYVKIDRSMRCVLYEPVFPVEKSQIAVICIHSDSDYSTFPIGGELAKRGYRALAGQVTDNRSTLDAKLLDVKHAIEFLRTIPGVKKVVLMGHSGGATLMSAYQAVAEKGPDYFRQDGFIYKCQLEEELPPADGFMSLDSNWGNGSMTLFSIDPAIIEEGSGMKIDPELDAYNPANGYDPEGTCYSEAFVKKFLAAQAERNNKIIERALERIWAIEHGKGLYIDDEPFPVTATSQEAPLNKIFPFDLRYMSHTKEAHTLVHKGGIETVEIVPSVRPARTAVQQSNRFKTSTLSSVRSYVSNRAVLAGSDYDFRPDCAVGIEWDKAYSCTPGNAKHITAPMLVMGMTGGYEYLAAEDIYNNSASTDKTLAFVEGASHNFSRAKDDPESVEKYGDTAKTTFDYVDKWLSAPDRYI
ncbi:MAG: alpha/beta hydrolase [Oscillospiraceae bacterium]